MTTLRQLAEAATPGQWEMRINEEGAWEDRWPTIHSKNDVIIGNEGFYSDKDIDKANAAYISAANPAAILALLDDLDLTNEMNAQLREQNTSLDKACAELEAANDAFAKRQEWWNNRMFELEVTIDALCKMLERDEAVLVNTAYWKSDLSRDISVHLEETE